MPLNPGGYARLSGKIDFAGDVDMFKFTTTKAGFNLVALSCGSIDGTMEVYDAQGNLLATLEGKAGQEAIHSFNVQGNQTYYVKVSAGSGQTGDYDVTVWMEKNLAPTMEPIAQEALRATPDSLRTLRYNTIYFASGGVSSKKLFVAINSYFKGSCALMKNKNPGKSNFAVDT